MDAVLDEMPPLRAALLWAVPLIYVAAALAAGALSRTPPTAWRLARWGAAAAGLAALASMAWLLMQGAALARGPALFSLGELGAAHASVRSDAVGATLLLLVGFIGWVITGYSQTYLDGERGQRRYIRNLMLTLAAVSALVLTNNLLLLALAWIATSLALHGLLTFFDRRPQALIAAHKKFLASRVADGLLLGGIALIGTTLGTLEVDRAIAAAQALPAWPAALQAAALMVAASALLKCAQLPVHGWLIQVMEAPTPVSALLHAGVVNLGGFLLIRMGALVADAPAAQALLVVVGSITAVVAALVMTTRISIKVSLAWSTCAQMGFMMMQCGLGLHHLALLHLVAHSLYKAHAFLAAGGAVEQNRLHQMTPPAPPVRPLAWLLSAGAGAVLVGGAAMLWDLPLADSPALLAMAGVLSLAIAPLLAGAIGPSSRWASLAAAFAVPTVYFGLHAVLERGLGLHAAGGEPSAALVGWVLGCFGLLYLVQGAVRIGPHGRLARRLYPWLFAGLYLDELFTRLTFRVWPARLPAAPAVHRLAARPTGRSGASTAAARSTPDRAARTPGALS